MQKCVELDIFITVKVTLTRINISSEIKQRSGWRFFLGGSTLNLCTSYDFYIQQRGLFVLINVPEWGGSWWDGVE